MRIDFKWRDYDEYSEWLHNALESQEMKIEDLQQEISRLNNIINEYRKGIENMWVDNAGEDTWIYNGEDFLSRQEFLDKLKELKEDNKDV